MYREKVDDGEVGVTGKDLEYWALVSTSPVFQKDHSPLSFSFHPLRILESNIPSCHPPQLTKIAIRERSDKGDLGFNKHLRQTNTSF